MPLCALLQSAGIANDFTVDCNVIACKQAGIFASQAAARIVLQDWNDGRIPFFTRPPKRDDHGGAAAAIVPAWGADFNAEAVRGTTHAWCLRINAPQNVVAGIA